MSWWPPKAHALIWNSRAWQNFKGQTVLWIVSTEAQPPDQVISCHFGQTKGTMEKQTFLCTGHLDTQYHGVNGKNCAPYKALLLNHLCPSCSCRFWSNIFANYQNQFLDSAMYFRFALCNLLQTTTFPNLVCRCEELFIYLISFQTVLNGPSLKETQCMWRSIWLIEKSLTKITNSRDFHKRVSWSCFRDCLRKLLSLYSTWTVLSY